MNNLKKHKVLYIDIETLISLLKNNTKTDYNNLGIKLSYNFALCQVLFIYRKTTANPYTLFVSYESYCKDRIQILEYIVQEIFVKKYQLGMSKITLQRNALLVLDFLNWADKRKTTFNSIGKARKAYMSYSQWLKTKMRKGIYSSKTSFMKQQSALKLLKYLNNDKKNEINVGINTIPCSTSQPTKKSSTVSQKYHFNFYYSLFHQLTDFLLNKQHYPCKLTLSDKIVWAIPRNTMFITIKNKDIYPAFDFFTGYTRNVKEIKLIVKENYPTQAYDAKRDFKNSLFNNNTNMKSNKRLALGSKAIYAFYMLFLSITGMNDSTAATLKWNDDYLIEKSFQNFRNIKYRAANKVVEFQIQKKFIKDFKKYLKLREFVLDGNKIDSLFFMGYGSKAHISIKQSIGYLSSYIGMYMRKRIDPDLPLISSRKMRVNKTYQVIQKNGIIAASELAQSSKKTIINSYLGETQESADEQLTKFFNQLNDNVIFTNEKSESISVGQCKNYNNPKTNISLNGIKTNCKQSEGCLFCEHYGCHADEIDVRKLLSLLYVINECKYISKNDEQYTQIYGPVINRIQDILQSIEKQNITMIKMVAEIKEDVFENENLHYYWEHKLSMLIEIGMIT